MQKVQLTKENDNTVFVGDVNPRTEPIFAKNSDTTFLVLINSSGRFGLSKPVMDFGDFTEINTSNGLCGLMEMFSGCQFFTLDNRRIVTEKVLTVDDLKDTDHVGFVDGVGDKGYIAYIGDAEFKKICTVFNPDTDVCNPAYNSGTVYKGVSLAAMSCRNSIIYKFPTRKALYKWLSE